MEHSSFIDTLYTVSEIFVIGANTKVVDWIVGTRKHLHIWWVSQAYFLYLNSILWCTLINSVFIIFWEIKRYFPSAIHHWSKWMKMEIRYLGTEIWIVTTKIIAITMCELMHGEWQREASFVFSVVITVDFFTRGMFLSCSVVWKSVHFVYF